MSTEEGEFQKRFFMQLEEIYGKNDSKVMKELIVSALEDAKKDFPTEVFEAIKNGALPHATSDRLQAWFKKWFGE